MSQAIQSRYGNSEIQVLEKLEPFLIHRSVRQYSDKPVSENLIQQLVACAQSASTSSNLQLWSLISIQNPDKRERIAKLAADQNQIRNAPWFFAFLADHNRIKIAAKNAGIEPNGLDYMEFFAMAIIDVALASERMVCAAESIGLSVCYIGAMRNNPEQIANELKLPKGVFCPFGLCLGYPSENNPSKIKPRLNQNQIWFHEEYPENFDLQEYDERMKSFYASENMKGEVTWSMRSGRRVDGNHMTGREILKPWLESRGFAKR